MRPDLWAESQTKRVKIEAHHASALLQVAIDAMPSHVAILDASGIVLLTNLAWRLFYRDRKHTGECGVGTNFLAVCEAAAASRVSARKIANGLRAVLNDTKAEFGADQEFGCGSDVSWLRIHIRRHAAQGAAYVSVVREDVTEIKQVETTRRQLTRQLISAQDAARRHVARELHDTTAQNLFGAAVAVQRASSYLQGGCRDARACLAEAASLISTSQNEIRTLSYLLYPPMLDEAGLPAALRWYIESAIRRTGLDITLETDPQFEACRLPLETGTALFRVAQEALTNIHRHSGSAVARITLRPAGPGLRQARLEVSDDGCGLPLGMETCRRGVGLMGMSERMRQVGGDVVFRRRAEGGTTVIATVPISGPASEVGTPDRL